VLGLRAMAVRTPLAPYRTRGCLAAATCRCGLLLPFYSENCLFRQCFMCRQLAGRPAALAARCLREQKTARSFSPERSRFKEMLRAF